MADPRANERDVATPEGYQERLDLYREKLLWVRDYL